MKAAASGPGILAPPPRDSLPQGDLRVEADDAAALHGLWDVAAAAVVEGAFIDGEGDDALGELLAEVRECLPAGAYGPHERTFDLALGDAVRELVLEGVRTGYCLAVAAPAAGLGWSAWPERAQVVRDAAGCLARVHVGRALAALAQIRGDLVLRRQGREPPPKPDR